MTSTVTATAYPTEKADSFAVSDSCHRSSYVSEENVEDGTVFAPGETFVKTWTVVNTGDCGWGRRYLLNFYDGDRMDGENHAIGRYVLPGHSAKISVTLTAPGTAGEYTGYWILANDFGTPFGGTFHVQIVVSDE